MLHRQFSRGKRSLLGFLSMLVLLLLLAACQPAPTAVPPPPAAPSATPTSLPPSLPTPIPASPTAPPTPTVIENLPSNEISPQPTLIAEPTQSAEAPTATAQLPAAPPSTTPPPEQAAAADCIDKAAFYGDVTIPDDTGFAQAASFTKTWRFRNEGDCTWDSSYALVFAGGEILNAPLVSPLAASIAPGQIAELSLDMRTPDRGGTFRGYWEFQNGRGVRFGTGAGGHDPFWVQVVVSWMPPGGGLPPGSGQDNSGGEQGNPGSGTNPSPTEAPPPPGENSGGEQPTPPPGGTPPPTPTPSQGAPGQGQSSLPGVPAGCAAQANNGFLQALLGMINRARSNNGLNELSPSAPLYAAAAVHSADMACNNFINHIGSDGSSWYTRIAAQGYSYSTALENIVVGNPDFGGNAQYAFDWWMNSQVHRDNILNPKVTELGLGYVYNPASEYGGYFTLVLARP